MPLTAALFHSVTILPYLLLYIGGWEVCSFPRQTTQPPRQLGLTFVVFLSECWKERR